MMENPIKIHDLGVPLFLETPIYMSHIVPLILRKIYNIATNPPKRIPPGMVV